MDAKDEYDRIMRQEGFDAGAHQAMQETRLEIALNLIRQVTSEVSDNGLCTLPSGYGLAEVVGDLETALKSFRNRSR